MLHARSRLVLVEERSDAIRQVLGFRAMASWKQNALKGTRPGPDPDPDPDPDSDTDTDISIDTDTDTGLCTAP